MSTLGRIQGNLSHQNKLATGLSNDMDGHCRPHFAFQQLEDADVTLPELVVAHKLEKRQVLEASYVARVVVAYEPLIFPVWPTKYDIVWSFL